MFGEEDGHDGGDGFDRAGEGTGEKGARFAFAFRTEGHGDNRTLGKVLNGDADGERQRSARGDKGTAGEIARIDDADGHAFGNIVDGDGEDEHRGAGERRRHAFGLVRVLVEMGHGHVEEKEKENPDPETDDGGDESKTSPGRALLDCGDDETPDGCSDHDAGGKSGEGFLHVVTDVLFHKKDARRAEGRADKGDCESPENFSLHRKPPLIS